MGWKNKEQRHAYYLRWKAANPDWTREYHKRNRERNAAYQREYRAKHPGDNAARCRKYRMEHREEVKRDRRRRYREGVDYILIHAFSYHQGRCELWRSDPAAYAAFRAKRREEYRRRVEARGGTYHPQPQRRIPDWACMGECDIRRGTMLVNAYSRNMLTANNAYKLGQVRGCDR